MKKILLALILTILPTAVYPCTVLSPPFQVKNIKHGVEKESKDKEICENWRMNAKEIKDWVQKAIFIHRIDVHNYSWYPCYVEADLIKDGKKAHIKIRAGILGEITYWNNKSSNLAAPNSEDPQD